jgi:hypothetical protein
VVKVTLQKQADSFLPYDAESVEFFKTLPENKCYQVSIVEASDLLDYKAVFWIWMRALAKSFTERGRETTDEEMHILMCHRYLGYTDEIRIGNTIIKPALRTLTFPEELSPDRWYALFRQIEDWFAEVGVALPVGKKPSQYSVLREKNG